MGKLYKSLLYFKREDVALAGAVGVIQAGTVPCGLRDETDGACFGVDFAADEPLDVVGRFEYGPPGAVVLQHVNREFLQDAGREAERRMFV